MFLNINSWLDIRIDLEKQIFWEGKSPALPLNKILTKQQESI